MGVANHRCSSATLALEGGGWTDIISWSARHGVNGVGEDLTGERFLARRACRRVGPPPGPGHLRSPREDSRLPSYPGTQTFTVLAEELDDTARAELWPTLVGQAPKVGDFQTRLTRRIPVFVLTRQD
jgi:hypothetical protein